VVTLAASISNGPGPQAMPLGFMYDCFWPKIGDCPALLFARRVSYDA